MKSVRKKKKRKEKKETCYGFCQREKCVSYAAHKSEFRNSNKAVRVYYAGVYR